MRSSTLLSLKEASLELGVSRPRVQQLVTAGTIRAVMVGNFWTISRKDLDAFRKLERKQGRKPGYSPGQRKKTTAPA